MATTRLIRNRTKNCDEQNAANYVLEQPYIQPAISRDVMLLNQWSSLCVDGIDIESSLKGINHIHPNQDKRDVVISSFNTYNFQEEVHPNQLQDDIFIRPCLIKQSRNLIKDVKPDIHIPIYNLQSHSISAVPQNINSRWIDR